MFHNLHGKLGITPIYMGSTFPQGKQKATNQDHPHIHGEHQQTVRTTLPSTGSPPYTWGALPSHIHCYTISRITPIYMGSTNISIKFTFHYWDHPHIHGEHSAGAGYGLRRKGSPPYTWGALDLFSVVV